MRLRLRYVPIALSGVLFAAVAAFVATQFTAYGRTWDEPHQDWYGQAVYQWYSSGFTDRSFLRFDPSLHMHQHGPFFEFVIAAAQHLLEPAWGASNHWHIRALVCGLAGALGLVGMALCGYELGGWWGAFLAALGLALYPRYTGAIFNNSKDLPLTAGLIFALWLTIRLVRHWDTRRRWLVDSALLGLVLGVTASIRINALSWFPVLLIAGVVAVLRDRTALRRLLLAGLVIGVACYLTILALWPYITLYPVTGLIDSYLVASRYPWNGIIPFEGVPTPAFDLPRRYPIEYLLIGSPPVTVLLGALGLGYVAVDLARRRRPATPVLLSAALFVVPLTLLVVLHPTLYNATRLFTFVVPGLVLVGVAGLLRLFSGGRAVRAAIAVVMSVTAVTTTVDMWRLHPLEYMYFSPAVGGYPAMKNRYETDYWAACQSLALDWLAAHRADYPNAGEPATVSRLIDGEIQLTGRTGLASVDGGRPDFFIDSAYFTAPPGYTKVYAVVRDRTEVCTVSARELASP